MSEVLLTEVRDRTLIMTLNRHDARNALNTELSSGLVSALARLDGDDRLSVGVVAGNGPAFCAGMDLKAFASEGPPKGLDRLLVGVARKPLIAAVEGFALGGGLELALTADLIVAGRGARFGVSEVTVGLFAAGGALLRLPRAIPQRVAMELALTGDPITAEQAHSWGLVNRLVDEGAAIETAIELAARVSANAPLGVIASKELVYDAFELTADLFWKKQRTMFAAIARSDDAREGPRAFTERRAPVWTGR